MGARGARMVRGSQPSEGPGHAALTVWAVEKSRGRSARDVSRDLGGSRQTEKQECQPDSAFVFVLFSVLLFCLFLLIPLCKSFIRLSSPPS